MKITYMDNKKCKKIQQKQKKLKVKSQQKKVM